MVGLSELSWEDQQKLQEQLQQQKEWEKDQPINNLNVPFGRKTKNHKQVSQNLRGKNTEDSLVYQILKQSLHLVE